ncbi:autotransporter outer membrane beta-barrel domain-containing protein [Dinoroseobacter sp. S76]|uniref:autotransporter outer membrane beta-barrel domain-containing protein n=1 Tax=Dinoroseobacter sp. S76 TaxID=3415124 RepID=UPI003C7D7660
MRFGPGIGAICLTIGGPAPAQDLPIVGVLGRAVEEQAAEALAIFGLIAVPNDAASTISLDGAGGATDLLSIQTGGGFRVSEEFPLYLEGFAGFQRYDPRFVLSNGTDSSETFARWNAAAVTGGAGWEFDISERFVIRPMVHLTLGTVVSDLELGAKFIGNQVDKDLDFLIDGSLTAGGYGASISGVYELLREDYEFEFSARLSHMELRTISSSSDVDASSDVSVASFWTRYRRPIDGWRAFDQPVRWVVDGSLGIYEGGPNEFPGIDWLAGIGAGLELDVSETKLIFTERARLMARYYFGEKYRGYGLGISISF